MEWVYLLLGTNQGDKRQNLSTAISLLVTELATYLFSEIKESSIHESEPWGFESEENFLNQAIAFQTNLAPEKLLAACKYVERKMGRSDMEPEYDSDGNRVYKSRIIDIDILLYGERKVDLPELKIPHPRLQEREFALIPLREILLGDTDGE